MRIGFLLPSVFSIDNPGNGIAEQARMQAAALERLGHTVERLNPWQWQDERDFDVLHFYLGGPALYHITRNRQLNQPGLLVFSPIIDSNQSFMSYRIAARLGTLSSRLLTIPAILQEQARGSDVVICRSRHERERLTRGLGIHADKVEIVLNGGPPPSGHLGDPQHVRQALGLPADFVLHISAFTQSRKNVLRLAEAAEPLGYPLVLAGRSTSGAILQQLERKARYRDRLRILGFVDGQTKAALYALCRVFCLPSIHEGTGLVALEAGAHGTNLVITKKGGPPDYFLDHADYVDPFDTQDIKRAIARAWERPKNTLLQQPIAEHMTWDHSAQALQGAYQKHLARLRNCGRRLNA